MENFVKKLKIILDNEGLSASKFSEKIGVQRSSVSHILSGRNKPSLDFILKIKNSIKNIDLEWLISEKIDFKNENPDEILPLKETNIDEEKKNDKNIDRIVVFFKDGTFKNYSN